MFRCCDTLSLSLGYSVFQPIAGFFFSGSVNVSFGPLSIRHFKALLAGDAEYYSSFFRFFVHSSLFFLFFFPKLTILVV